MPAIPHVLIIGGGFGGLSAARRLRAADLRVTLLDRRNHHVFQPLLYQVATATLSPGDIASPIRWILRRQRNIRVLLGEAAGIDLERRSVQLADGAAIDYDYLILATGARHTYFGHDGWAQAAPGLKTLEDALDMRRRVLLAFERAERESDPARQQTMLTFIIVGGGPTGVELAGTLAEIARHTLPEEFRSVDTSRTRIVLIEAGPAILATFPEKLRAAARRSLSGLGVTIREHTTVIEVDAHGVTLAGGERLDAGAILWAAGVAASPVARTLNAPGDRAGRIVVNADLSVPGHPEVFVVGDAASFHQAGNPLPGVAQVAIQGAAHAAGNVLLKIGGAPTRPFHYRDKGNMAIIGRGSAVAVLGRLQLAGFVAWCLWLFVHIFQLIGFRNRLVVMIQWAAAYVTFQRSVRLITYQRESDDA